MLKWRKNKKKNPRNPPLNAEKIWVMIKKIRAKSVLKWWKIKKKPPTKSVLKSRRNLNYNAQKNGDGISVIEYGKKIQGELELKGEKTPEIRPKNP